MSQLLMIALAVCLCSAAPTTELVVPEYLDFTAASKLAPTAFLQAVIKSGGTKGDCRTFATTTISDIETAVSSQQGVLNAIDNGDGCAAMGQTLVTSTKAAVVSAQALVVTKQGEAATALSAKNTACSARVDFSVGLETLEANSCYDYTSQTGYTQAKASCVAATSALATADAAVVTAQTVVTDAQATAADAVAEAARLESGCLCRVHQEQAAAQVAVQAATATNAADWKQAHEVLCAVEQTAPCPVPSCPTVEQPKLADGVDNADTQHCTAAPTCLNSNGIDGFDFSHDGYFAIHPTLQGITSSVAACADICRADASCTAFNRLHQGYPPDRRCYTYGAARGSIIRRDESPAYIRCV